MNTLSPDVEILHPETLRPETAPANSPSPEVSRCQHRYPNGVQCRLRGPELQSGLCLRHFREKLATVLPPAPSDSEDLSAILLRGPLKFSSAEDLREYLTRLLILMTEGRVSPRRASVLVYIVNQLLHTHSVVLKEEELEDKSQPAFFELPRPHGDSESSQ